MEFFMQIWCIVGLYWNWKSLIHYQIFTKNHIDLRMTVVNWRNWRNYASMECIVWKYNKLWCKVATVAIVCRFADMHTWPRLSLGQQDEYYTCIFDLARFPRVLKFQDFVKISNIAPVSAQLSAAAELTAAKLI